MRRIAAAVAAALVATGCGGTDATPRVVVGARTPSFRVLYRVVHTERPGEQTVSWDVLTVQRPFVGSDLTFDERPDLAALGTPRGGTVADIDHLYSVDGASLRTVAGRQPGLPTGDHALVQVATEAAARGLARIKGADTVAGRRCTIVQFVEPPVGTLKPFTDAKNHDDVCLSPGGVTLRETWTLNGRVVQSREAVAFADVPEGALDTSNAEPVPGTLAAPRVTPIDEGLTPPPAPNGYITAAAVDFALPRADAPSELAYASKVWAFAKGADEITVELGAGQVQPFNADQERPLRLGARQAATVVRSDGFELHWSSGDHWIRVRGSVSLPALVRYGLLVSSWDSSPAAVPR